VPFNVAAEYSEMVFNVASLPTVLVMGKKRLGAKEPAWEGLVDQNILRNWNNVTVVTKSFPVCSSHVLDFKASCNATKTIGLSRTWMEAGSTSLKVLVAEKEHPVSTMQVKAWGVFLVMSLKSCPEEWRWRRRVVRSWT
jgi:hypothetical protein